MFATNIGGDILSTTSRREVICLNMQRYMAYCTLRNETKRNHCETKPNETSFQTQFYINDSYHFLLTN